MNIELLKKQPSLNKNIKLIIEPLAPLSMVSDLPGTYYKVQEIPDKFKLAGLFENILGWHFSKKDREAVLKQMKTFHRKEFEDKNFEIEKSNSTYQPLLLDFFEIGMVYKSESVNYNDLWKRSFSRMDADVHPKGTSNLDYQTLREKGWIKNENQRQEEIKKKIKGLDSKNDKEEIQELKEGIKKSPLLQFFEKNKKSYPMYYTSPTLREYTDYLGQCIQMSLKIDQKLLSLLSQAFNECSSAYLGNSEGWVEIKIDEL